MPTILDRIVEVKRLELERHMAQTPLTVARGAH